MTETPKMCEKTDDRQFLLHYSSQESSKKSHLVFGLEFDKFQDWLK